MENKEKKEIKISLKVFIIIFLILFIGFVIFVESIHTDVKKNLFANGTISTDTELNITENKVISENIKEKTSIEKNLSAEFSSIELSFLKLENQKENKLYSPLSLKYALKMLEDATSGTSKEQITNLLKNSKITKYESNENMSLANSLFVKNTFESEIKKDYIKNLEKNYNADVIFDSFETADNINAWVNDKTLKLIPEIVQNEDLENTDFALINALAIDMDWEEKFIMHRGCDGTYPSTEFLHEKRKFDSDVDWEVQREKGIDVYDITNVSSNTFINETEELKVSGMKVYATINNYDIVNELGEENIKQIVGDDYRKFAKGEPHDTEHAYGDFPLSDATTDEGIDKDLEEFLPTYISQLDSNYHNSGSSSDFSMYIDENVKIFAKDLKEYDGTTLQYIGIMPRQENLDTFINNITEDSLSNYISNLKTLSYENFKEGVVTRITGFIPKFDFEYSLDLKEDLKIFNLTDVFDSKTANLSNLTDAQGAFIENAIHKANIEFTQDGIKAAAVTMIGGGGGGCPYDYVFDVPVEDIDITFDRPYMFLVRDVKSNETWFIGTVYEPLLWENEPENNDQYYYY